MGKQIHFNQILVNATTTHVMSTWKYPEDQQAGGLLDSGYWKNIAKTLERGLFDAVFFADTLTMSDETPEAMARVAMENGGNYPRQDCFALIPLMADVTKHLGFTVTMTTAGTPPFLAVRRLGTLDNMSRGRLGWNVVTSAVRSDFSALGIEQPAHTQRYDIADEYMEICYRLWSGFPHEALLLDKERGLAVDVTKIKKVDFDGKYYSCHAYPITPASVQGRPLIFQAGQSGRGMRFAAQHADAIYAVQPRLESMKRYMSDVREAAAKEGKSDPRVFFGVQPIVGSTEEEARRRRDELRDRIPIEAALNRLGALIGRTFELDDLDKPLEDFETQASKGFLTAILESIEGRAPTIREAAVHWGMAIGMPQFAGTPEQVADWIEDLWRRIDCHGFAISPNVNPLSVETFVDQVVPILQARGVYRQDYPGTTLRDSLMN